MSSPVGEWRPSQGCRQAFDSAIKIRARLLGVVMTISVDDNEIPVMPEMIELFSAAEAWKARTGRISPDPAAGSSLAGDDRATDPYYMSAAVLSLMTSAVDNFHAVHALIISARIIHTSAPFTLLRAALENASVAVYLLAPTSRPERVERRLRLLWAEWVDAENAREAMGQGDPARHEKRRQKVMAVGRAARLSESAMGRLTARPEAYAKIVGGAGREAFGESAGRLAVVAWMLNSGIAHGRGWAGLAVSETEVIETTHTGLATMRMTGSQSTILQQAQITSMMIARGWNLLDQRQTCHVA